VKVITVFDDFLEWHYAPMYGVVDKVIILLVHVLANQTTWKNNLDHCYIKAKGPVVK